MKTKFFIAFAASLLISTAAFAVSKDAATDDRGEAVRSTNGKCIRTKWNFEDDICKPKKAPEPAPEPAPVPVVEKAPEPEAPKTKLAKELNKDEKTIYFDFDKAVISAEEKEQLDSVAKVLLTDKEVESVKIVAYADKMGSTEYNDKLSQKRATAVNDYLNEKGYLKTTVAETAWFGESNPKTECPDKLKRAEKIKCLAEDRRAEIVINYYEVKEVPVATPTTEAPKAAEPTPAPAAEAPAVIIPEATEPKSGEVKTDSSTVEVPPASSLEAPASEAPTANTPEEPKAAE